MHEEAERSLGGRVKNEPPGTKGPEGEEGVGDEGDAGNMLPPSRETGDPGGGEEGGMVSMHSSTGVGGLIASFGGTNSNPEMALEGDVGGGGIVAFDGTTGDPGSELTLSFSFSSNDSREGKWLLTENRREDERESVM